MSSPTQTRPATEAVPPLVNGDHLDQPTFHRRYEAMPEGTNAELIGGIVYMASPTKRQHGGNHFWVIGWLAAYAQATPGIEGYDNTSNLLGPESESQPDICLLVPTEAGGQSSHKDDCIVGPPELVAEVAHSSEAIDLHAKKDDYQKAGVREYLVLALRQKRIYWFANRDEQLVEMRPGDDGVYRSEVFPGLWLDPAALLARDMGRVLSVLAAGLATPEHAAFVARLAANAGGNPK